MQNIPTPIRRIRSSDSITSNKSFASFSSFSSSMNDAKREAGGILARILCCRCCSSDINIKNHSSIDSDDSFHSYSSDGSRSSGTLTLANKKVHDMMTSQKRIDATARVKGTKYTSVEGGLKRNVRSYGGLCDMQQNCDPVRTLPSNNNNDFRPESGIELRTKAHSFEGISNLTKSSNPDLALVDVDNATIDVNTPKNEKIDEIIPEQGSGDDEYFIGGGDESSSLDSDQDYDLDTSRRG